MPMSNIVAAPTQMHLSTRLLMLNAMVYANQLDSHFKKTAHDLLQTHRAGKSQQSATAAVE